MKQVALIAGVLYGPFNSNKECADWAEAQPGWDHHEMWFLDVHPPTKLIIPDENDTMVRAWCMQMELDIAGDIDEDFLATFKSSNQPKEKENGHERSDPRTAGWSQD